MKITATPIPSGAAIVLGDDSTGALVIDPPFLPVETRAVQVNPLFRAPNALAVGRENRLRSFAWVVARVHASLAAAAAFIHTHPGEVPINCSLAIDDQGATWNYSSAVIQQVACVERTGVSTKWQYTVVGAIYAP